MKWIFIGGFTGIVLGALSAQVLFVGSAISVLVWGFAGVVLGLLFARENTGALLLGSAYGYALTISFMLKSFGGTPDKLPGYVGLTLALTLVGMLCGVVSVFTGSWLAGKFGYTSET